MNQRWAALASRACPLYENTFSGIGAMTVRIVFIVLLLVVIAPRKLRLRSSRRPSGC